MTTTAPTVRISNHTGAKTYQSRVTCRGKRVGIALGSDERTALAWNTALRSVARAVDLGTRADADDIAELCTLPGRACRRLVERHDFPARLLGEDPVVVVPVSASVTTLADEIAKWEHDLVHRPRKARKPATALRNARKVRAVLIQRLGYTTSDEIALTDVQSALAELEQGSSPGTVRGVGIQLRAFTRWLVARLGTLRVDPLGAESDRECGEGLVLPEYDPVPTKDALKDDEIDRLIKAAERGSAYAGVSGPERALIYELAVGCGLRLREVAYLQRSEFRNLDEKEWDDNVTPLVQLSARVKTKTSRRPVPVPLETARLVAARFAAGSPLTPSVSGLSEQRLFPSAGEGYCKGQVQYRPRLGVFLADLDAAGIQHCRPEGLKLVFHSLRNSFGRRQSRKHSLAVVSQLMRHADVKTTSKFYLQLGLTELAESIAALPPVRRSVG